MYIKFQLLNPMQSGKNFLESLDYLVFFIDFTNEQCEIFLYKSGFMVGCVFPFTLDFRLDSTLPVGQ